MESATSSSCCYLLHHLISLLVEHGQRVGSRCVPSDMWCYFTPGLLLRDTVVVQHHIFTSDIFRHSVGTCIPPICGISVSCNPARRVALDYSGRLHFRACVVHGVDAVPAECHFLVVNVLFRRSVTVTSIFSSFCVLYGV